MKTKKYTVIRGCADLQGKGEQAEPGDTLELTESQARALVNKVVLVEKPKLKQPKKRSENKDND